MAADGKALKNQQSLYEIAEGKPGSKVIVTFMHIAWVMNATLTYLIPQTMCITPPSIRA
jgi:hypothetical protein